MSKLLLTYEKDMPTVAMHRKAAFAYAEKAGTEVRFKQVQEVTREDLNWCDVLELIRSHDPYSAHLAKRAQEAGRFVIAYYDDDLYNLPGSMPNPFWRKNSVLKTLRHANMIYSSSRYICDKYRSYTVERRSYAGDTIVEPQEVRRIDPAQDDGGAEKKVKLIYAAAPGHVGFFDRFILPVMPQLCQRYGHRISMTFMGVRPELTAYESQMELHYYSTMPLEEYRQKIREGGYDIGLSPLTSDDFTKCKYFNKFMEYTMAGIVGVYSQTEPYTYVVRDGINGFLAEDAPENWFDCLCRAIDDPCLRTRCICAAQEQLLTEFSPEALTAREAAAIPELRSYHASDRTCGGIGIQKLLHRLLVVPDRVHQTVFYLKHTGFSGLWHKIKSHLRNAKAYS